MLGQISQRSPATVALPAGVIVVPGGSPPVSGSFCSSGSCMAVRIESITIIASPRGRSTSTQPGASGGSTRSRRSAASHAACTVRGASLPPRAV